MAPITSASVAMPLTTTTVAANLPSTVDVAQATVSLQESPTTAVASASVSVARSAVARVDLPAQASPWAPRAAPKMTVSSAPTVPAMVQTSTAMAPTRTAPWREVRRYRRRHLRPSWTQHPWRHRPKPCLRPSAARSLRSAAPEVPALQPSRSVNGWLRVVFEQILSAPTASQRRSKASSTTKSATAPTPTVSPRPCPSRLRWAGRRQNHQPRGAAGAGSSGRANVASAVAEPRQRPPPSRSPWPRLRNDRGLVLTIQPAPARMAETKGWRTLLLAWRLRC